MLAFHLDSVDSTNEEAKRLLLRGEVSSVAYVSAREQTAGRGSRGRTWVSPRDAGVYLSVIQRFDKGLDPATISVEGFTLAAGVACAELLHEVFDVDVRLKPINDLYVGSAKLGGILVESIVEASLVRALVTGIGLNLRSADRTLSAGASPPVAIEELVRSREAYALRAASFVPELVAAVLAWNSLVATGGMTAVLEAWERWQLPGTPKPPL